jgi:hypothetical protein
VLTALLLSAAGAAAPPAHATWSLLQEKPVRIECTTTGGSPYCRSTGVIGAQASAAARTFSTLDQHVDKMGAIRSVTRLEADVLHVVMDYPFPLSDRDYVARFSHRTEPGGVEVYAWQPVTHAGAPPQDGVVRLSWLDGEWRFAPEGGRTRVTYLWQSDPGGNLPDVDAVRRKAGTLAVQDMAAACGTAVTSP